MPQAAQRVGEYILDEMLGQGAYAQVWRAHHHMWSDQLVAVKIPIDPVYVANLRQEGIRIHRLSHPNIVKPIGFDPMADPPYLMSEFMAGGSLRPLIEQRKLSVSDSINILRQVLTALQYGHEQGIIHGDIKPDNVLLEESAAASGYTAPGSVKVTDFGIGLAAMATATGDAAGKIHAQRGGTLAYLATEQREGAQPDVRSDVYAVGVMLFELLTGERPSGAELPSELNPQSPKSLDEIFRRSYARRERRFASAREFLDALPEDGEKPAPALVAEPFHRAAPPPPPPPPVEADHNDDDALLIGFRDDDDDAPVKLAPAPASAPVETIEPVPTAASEDDQPAVQDEFSESQEPGETGAGDIGEEKSQVALGETLTPEQSHGLAIPPVPSVPSRADRDAVFDELANKQLRSGEDIRGVMRQFFESRDLDEGESNNIRLRLVKWANGIVGGDSDFDQQIVLSRALARPVYQVTLATRNANEETLETRVLDSSGGVCQEALQRDDYRLLGHLSTNKFAAKSFDGGGGAEGLRTLVIDLIRDSSQSGSGAIQRQDLFIGRANVVVVDYQFEGTRQRAFMVGNALEIVSPNNPFAKIREDPTKRAATLLDGEHIRLGIKELRRGLDSKWQDKASVILNALRGKLAAAYIAEAKALSGSFGWLESLEMTGKAGQLVTGSDDALQHAALVRKRTSQVQLIPGLVLTVVFLFIAVMNLLDAKLPAKDIALYLLTNSFFLAGIAAVIATLWSWKVISTRMSRTDFAFYQAMLLPTLVGGILALAPEKFFVWKLHWQGDLVCCLLLAIVITADVLLFKYLRRYLIRPPAAEPLGGDEATILLQIETMLDQDWDRLQEHYLKLDPLYSYAGVRTQLPADFQVDRAEPAPPTTAAAPPRETAAPKPSPQSTGNEDVDRLAKQVISRVNSGARALIPPGRMLITLLAEYTRSVDRQQLGMAQSNAQKLEQKGKDLSDKLADFEQVCRSPLTLDSNSASLELKQLSQEMAQRPEEPDFAIVRSFADRAKNFRADQAGAVAEMTRLLPEFQEALDRFKKL